MWDITTPTVGAGLLAVSCTGRDLERWKVTIPADHRTGEHALSQHRSSCLHIFTTNKAFSRDPLQANRSHRAIVADYTGYTRIYYIVVAQHIKPELLLQSLCT